MCCLQCHFTTGRASIESSSVVLSHLLSIAIPFSAFVDSCQSPFVSTVVLASANMNSVKASCSGIWPWLSASSFLPYQIYPLLLIPHQLSRSLSLNIVRLSLRLTLLSTSHLLLVCPTGSDFPLFQLPVVSRPAVEITNRLWLVSGPNWTFVGHTAPDGPGRRHWAHSKRRLICTDCLDLLAPSLTAQWQSRSGPKPSKANIMSSRQSNTLRHALLSQQLNWAVAQ